MVLNNHEDNSDDEDKIVNAGGKKIPRWNGENVWAVSDWSWIMNIYQEMWVYGGFHN